MDSDSFEADRNVLRKLYSLLQINEFSEQSALSEILDGRSRSFLKKLLDDAAERMFEAHIKIMVDNWRSELGTNSLGQLEEAKVPPERSHLAAKSSSLNQRDAELMEKPNRVPSVTSRLRRFTSELQSRRKQRCVTCEQSSKLEVTNKTVARSTNRTTPEKEVEDKASKVEELSNKVDVAMASIELLIPSLNRLAKPIRGLASSAQIGGPVQNLMDTTTGTKAYQDDCKNKYMEKSKERVGLATVDKVEPRGKALRKKIVENDSEETWSESSDSESSWTTVSSSSSASSWTTIQGSESESSRNSPDYESSRTQYYTSSQSSSCEYDTSSSRSQSSGGRGKAGKLTRLKNKLGLIFHHSRRHHRPHKNKSVWKRFRDTGKNGRGKNPNKTGRKQKELAKYNGGNHKKGKQIGQLRTLAKGLFMHVKQPKMSKLRGKKTNLWLNRVRITTNKPRLKLRGRPKKPKLTNFSETH
ncbi:hypothetical protein V2J09_000699 [Rumex salicifolius]